MNWTTFFAMLARDAHVARRNLPALLTQTMLQPLLFTFVFGRVMISSGMMPSTYKGMLVPGIMGMSMVLTGIQAVSMPLIAEFQFTREIEDRLLAPMRIEWLAVEKILAGMVQALASGTVVVVAAWLMLGTRRRPERAAARAVCDGGVAGGAVLGVRRAGAGMQRGTDADRTDVQPGAGADDFFRLRLLSVERAGGLSR